MNLDKATLERPLNTTGGWRGLARVIDRHKLLAALVVTVVVRLAVFAVFPLFRFDESGAIHGSEAYDTYAQNLLATGVYGRTPGVPDAVIPPLYSYVLAGVYGALGRTALAVVAFHIALDCLSIVCLYHTGRRVFGFMAAGRGAWVGALAGLFYALYPYLIFQNLTLIDTPFFMALLHAFVLLVVMLRERERLDRGTWALAAGAGVVLGLSMLTRSLLPLLAVMVAVWYLFRLPLVQAFLRLLPVAVVGLVVMLPWIGRNFGVYNTFIPTALNFGDNFYQGNSVYTIPYFRAGYDVQWVPPPDTMTATDVFSPLAAQERFEAGMDYLRTHPEQIGDLIWTKFLVHWSIDIAPRKNPTEGQVPRLDYQGNVIPETDAQGNMALGSLPPGDPVGAYSTPLFDQIGRPVHMVYWGGLLALGLVGVWLTRGAWREVSVLWFVQISMTVMYIVFHPSTRYRVPSDPLLFLFSAYAVLWLVDRFQARANRL